MILNKPTNDAEYKQQEEVLNKLIDVVRDDESHPLAIVMQIIGDNMERYFEEHYPPIGHDVSHVEFVTYLMEKNDLKQKDMAPIFGGQANVLKFLSGKRPITKTQVQKIKERFGISADFFI